MLKKTPLSQFIYEHLDLERRRNSSTDSYKIFLVFLAEQLGVPELSRMGKEREVFKVFTLDVTMRLWIHPKREM